MCTTILVEMSKEVNATSPGRSNWTLYDAKVRGGDYDLANGWNFINGSVVQQVPWTKRLLQSLVWALTHALKW